jgi:PAS domain-containing protein
MIGDPALQADVSPLRRDALRLETELGLPAEILQPVLEGARARGMAEAFEAMGRPAIFLDGGGAILYAAPSAQKLFGSSLALAGRQLVARSAEGNAILESLIAEALAGRTTAADMPESESGERLRLNVQPGPNPHSTAQLLRAILFLDLLPAPSMAAFQDISAA